MIVFNRILCVMYQPPFHRRILPWIFTIVFFAAAPALVFYTAGYRWNSKKDKVERNGTLIIDSRPTGARVILNGEDSLETTPITLQNAAPGSYLIRLERDGYHPWEKHLDVQPEYVTFANDVWLWKISQPVLVVTGSSTLLEASPNEKFLASVEARADHASVNVWDPENNTNQVFALSHLLHPGIRVAWSDDSRSLLLEDRSATGTNAWLINVRTGVGPIALPRGRYEWSGSRLEGSSESSEISIRTNDGAVTYAPLPAGVEDRYTDVVIRHATGTDNLVLFQENNPKRGLILPSGSWYVVTTNDNQLVLRDGQEWLSVDPDAPTPAIRRVQGDRLRVYTQRGNDIYMLVNGGEVWLWNATGEPELLLRQSQPLAEALWHAGGSNILLATDSTVSILNLDPRDGRINTLLAEFDKVHDIALIKKTLYVTGTKGGQSGVWSLVIE